MRAKNLLQLLNEEEGKKKVNEFKIEDLGLVKASIHGGYGELSGGNWKAYASGVATSPRKAFGDAILKLDRMGWELSRELMDESKKFDEGSIGIIIEFDYDYNIFYKITKIYNKETTFYFLKDKDVIPYINTFNKNEIIARFGVHEVERGMLEIISLLKRMYEVSHEIESDLMKWATEDMKHLAERCVVDIYVR